MSKMLPLNTRHFNKLALISHEYVNITLVRIIKNDKIIAAGITANQLFDKCIPLNTQ